MKRETEDKMFIWVIFIVLINFICTGCSSKNVCFGFGVYQAEYYDSGSEGDKR